MTNRYSPRENYYTKQYNRGNGEPLPSFDKDIGGAQSQYSPFHPVNL